MERKTHRPCLLSGHLTPWLAGRPCKWIMLQRLCSQCCALGSQVTGPISMVIRKEMCIKWPLVVPIQGLLSLR